MRMYLSTRELWAQAMGRGRVKEEEDKAIVGRLRVLRRVDRELEKRNYKAALSLVKQLQGKPRGLRGFGAVKLVPRRKMSNKEEEEIDVSQRSLTDLVLHSIECCRQFALMEQEEVSSLRIDNSMDSGKIDDSTLKDQLKDHLMCLQHEAGHFLVGYMVGVLPKRYRVPSVEDLMEDKFVRGKVEFLGFDFLTQIGIEGTTKGKLSNEKINRFLCVILGGLVAEHLEFGYSELLHSDVNKVYNVLHWLGFTEEEGKSRLRYAAMNTIFILNQHHNIISRLAEAMSRGQSIAFCIHTIETTLNMDATHSL